MNIKGMNKKKKIILIEIALVVSVLLVGVTYSLYTAETDMTSSEQAIAEFVFNANKTDLIEIPLNDLIPGDNKEYNFEVTNNLDTNTSDVTIEYQITLKTAHTIPLTFELYSVTGTETLLFTCNESSGRNPENILECKSPVMSLDHSSQSTNDFRLNVIFPLLYNDVIYANLVDYVDIEIDSWQKLR